MNIESSIMKNIIVLLLILSLNVAHAQISNTLSNEEKIYTLSRLWQEANYSFIYFDKINQNKWNNLYKDYIGQVQKTKNDYEYYRLLQKFYAYLNDGHTNVWLPKEIRDSIYYSSFGEYRIFLTNIDEKAIITRVNKSKKSDIPIGTEIISVNGIKTRKYIEDNVIPYISASTDYVRQDMAVTYMLKGLVGTQYELGLKLPNSTIKKLNLTIAKSIEKDTYPSIPKKEIVELKWYDDIAYVALNSFNDWETLTKFQEKLHELKKAKSLILDLRNNGGGNQIVGKVILHYLTNDTVFYAAKSQSRIYIPSLTAENRGMYYHDFPYRPDTLGIGDRNLLKTRRIVVPTAILIGHRTASAAEDFLIYTQNQEHMIKIGQATFGSTGMPLILHLPGGGVARVCTKKETYPDGREFVGIGIQPDIEIRRELHDYKHNKDPALEKAIQYLRKSSPIKEK